MSSIVDDDDDDDVILWFDDEEEGNANFLRKIFFSPPLTNIASHDMINKIR
jgi:hypothetical protein